MLAVVVAVALVAVAAVVVRARGHSGDTGATPDPDAASFVTRNGTQLQVAGRPFAFVGFNLYDAAATSRYKCASWPRFSDAELDSALGYMHDKAGAKVLRFWAYQTYTAGGTDWSGVDRVLRLARKHGMRVVPVLEDGPGNCTTGPNNAAKSAYRGDTWYTQGYREPYGTAQLSYRDYVARVVDHYRADPTVLAWMMMNEAETKSRDGQGRSALVDFADDVGTLIKSIDNRHLVTVGTQANGAPGASGADFSDVYGVGSVDLTEVHDWATYGSDIDAIPGDVDDGKLPAADSSYCRGRDGTRIACSFAIAAQSLHKPLIVGEAGIAAQDGSFDRRAGLFDAKMRAAFGVGGASGYLVWHFNKVLDGQHYDVLQHTDDPLVPTMHRIAATLP